MRFQALFYLSLLSGFASLGQQLHVQHYPSEMYKGATQNWEMEQDDQGILYFANNDGVLTYDGREWNLIPLPNKDFVFSIALDQGGRIYVASYNELGYFQNDTVGKYQYHSLLHKLPKEYQSFKYLTQIVVFNNTVFFVDYDHIYLYRNNEFEVLNEKNVKIIKHHGELYFLKKNGLYKFHEKSLLSLDINKELAGINLKWVTDGGKNSFLIADDKNQIWKLNLQPSASDKLVPLSTQLNAYLKDIPRFKIIALDNGNIAVLSSTELLFFNEVGKPLYALTNNTIGENFTYRILYEDRQHNLWVTTNASILQVITSSPISYYDKHNGLTGVMLAFGKKDQHRYAGTNTGVFYKDSKTTFSRIPETQGEAWNFYNIHNKLYVAHGTGVIELIGKKSLRIIDHSFVHSLCELKNSPEKMLMGTYNTGIWLLEKKNGTWTKTKINGFEEETRFMLEDEEGYIWISHYNKGVFKLRLNDRMDSVVSQAFYNAGKGLPSNLNNRIFRLRTGQIVITTVNGVYRLNKTKNSFEPVEELNQALGQYICIYTLSETDQGDFYFWGGQPQNKEFAGVLKKQADGSFTLQITPFHQIAVPIRDLRIDVDAPLQIADTDEIWIGNKLRVLNYNPLQKTFFGEPFRTYIKQVWAKDSAILNITKNVPYSLNSFRIAFASSFFEKPEKTEYQYKLEGFQNNWSNWSVNNEAVFTNLPSGNYKFTVRAKNLYGNLSEPADYDFYVSPPWYSTWWAAVVYAVFAISFISLIVHLNTKRIKMKKLELENIVREKTKELTARNNELLEKKQEIIKQTEELEALNLTKDKLFSIVSHDLRAPIKQIQLLMNLMELQHISEDEFKAFIPKFKESIEDTVNLTDNLLHWANSQMEGIKVKPTRINLQEIAEENYQLFKPLADSKDISLINNISTSLFALADKDMIKLVLRNLINNAVKFTNHGEKIIIGAEPNQTQIEVFVKDTGIGLSAEEISAIFNKRPFSKQGTFGEKGVGIGLLLCQEFIEKNGGSIRVESEMGNGSKFAFKIPCG